MLTLAIGSLSKRARNGAERSLRLPATGSRYSLVHRPLARRSSAPLRQHTAGFTLLELLVVLLIIGITLSFAMLSIGDRTRERSVEEEAQRLAARLMLAEQEAILQAKEIALQPTREGYQFLALEYTSANKDGEWRVLEDDVLRPRRLPPGMSIDITAQGEGSADPAGKQKKEGLKKGAEQDHATRIYLLSSGEITPFEARLSDAEQQYFVIGEATGKLELRKQRARAERG